MTDGRFLNWLADRLVKRYGESEYVDFVSRLRRIADEIDKETKGTQVGGKAKKTREAANKP